MPGVVKRAGPGGLGVVQTLPLTYAGWARGGRKLLEGLHCLGTYPAVAGQGRTKIRPMASTGENQIFIFFFSNAIGH